MMATFDGAAIVRYKMNTPDFNDLYITTFGSFSCEDYRGLIFKPSDSCHEGLIQRGLDFNFEKFYKSGETPFYIDYKKSDRRGRLKFYYIDELESVKAEVYLLKESVLNTVEHRYKYPFWEAIKRIDFQEDAVYETRKTRICSKPYSFPQSNMDILYKELLDSMVENTLSIYFENKVVCEKSPLSLINDYRNGSNIRNIHRDEFSVVTLVSLEMESTKQGMILLNSFPLRVSYGTIEARLKTGSWIDASGMFPGDSRVARYFRLVYFYNSDSQLWYKRVDDLIDVLRDTMDIDEYSGDYCEENIYILQRAVLDLFGADIEKMFDYGRID